MSDDLKPCPFCGGAPDVSFDSVSCSCAAAPFVNGADSANTWNTRATLPPAVGVDATEDWRIKAAEWLEQKAQEQEANNAKWPEHAAAYAAWRQRPTEYRVLARFVRTATLPRADGGADRASASGR